MKTPTLMVRLVGIYLIVKSGITLLQIHQMKAMVGNGPSVPTQIVGDVEIYAILGLVAGLVATGFAGPLARLLTFDSGRE